MGNKHQAVTEEDFDNLWLEICEEVYKNRHGKGSLVRGIKDTWEQKSFNPLASEIKMKGRAFGRSLWYGGGNKAHLILNLVEGDNKGLRKCLRNGPKTFLIKIPADILGFVVTIISAPFTIFLGAVISITTYATISLLTKKVGTYNLSSSDDRYDDRYGKKIPWDEQSIWRRWKKRVKNIKEKFVEEKSKASEESEMPKEYSESLRRDIKHDFKDLHNGALSAINRNVLKLKSATSKIGPSLERLKKTVSSKGTTDNSSQYNLRALDAVEDAIRTTYEEHYYRMKVTRMIYNIEHALNENEKKLDDLGDCVNELHKALKKSITTGIFYEPVINSK